MEEKIKVYVDSNEKDFITDCYLADNTKIICEFYHEESEIEYSNCKLLNLQEYDKQKDQRIAELEQELNKANEKLKNITEEVENNFVHGQDYEKLKQELAELKEKAIVPKFKGSSIVYSIAFKEIEKVQVIAYLNRCIILCRNLKTRELHTIHCDYLFETEQEAQAKLKEVKGNG